MRARRQGGVAFVLVLFLGGCAAATPSTAPVATVGPSTTASVAAPTPTAGPDVAKLLAEQYGMVTSGATTMTGSLVIGNVRATFSGTGLFNGPDSTQTLTTTVGGTGSTRQTATVAGARYVRAGDGPWLADTSSSSGDRLRTALEDALDVAHDLDAGVVGSANHRIEAADRPFDPVTMGFAAAATGGTATYTFEAKPDGTPVSVAIAATWRQTGDGAPIDAALDLTLTFSDLGSRPRISAPDDVWERFRSARWAYQVARPSDFDLTSDDDYDLLIGPNERFVSMARASTGGDGLNLLARGEVALLKDMLGTKAVTNVGITLGGLNARLLSATGTNKELGGRVVIHEAIAVQGKFWYSFVWVSTVGNEAADLTTFRQLLSTVCFCE